MHPSKHPARLLSLLPSRDFARPSEGDAARSPPSTNGTRHSALDSGSLSGNEPPRRDIPPGLTIRSRLMSMLLSISFAMVVLTSAVFALYELLTFRQATLQHLEVLSRVIAGTSTAALAFNDPTGAEEILQSLRQEEDLATAVLYDAEGTLFAAYYREGTPPSSAPDELTSARGEFSSGSLEIVQPVEQDGRVWGYLYLRSDLGSLRRRLTLYGSILIVVVVASLLLAYGMSRVLQRRISDPLLALAETARAVSERRDYTVRAPPAGGDELGVLTEALNHMLTQIHDRDLALREGAERMRAVLDSALSAVIVVNADDDVLDWTHRAEQVFGWSRSQALGQPLAQLVVPPALQERYHQLRRAAFQTSDATFFGRPVETIALRRDGVEVPVEVCLSRLKSGASITICGFITDITERRRADEAARRFAQTLEARVAERTAQLENANRELEAFSYSVSHDLRAPLRHIDGFAALLSRHAGPSLDAQSQRYLTTIAESARSLGRLIDDLLAFSRTGRSSLHRVPVDQDALVADIITEGTSEPAERPVDWHVDTLPTVEGDPTLLRLVWRNLISNAVKYSSRVTHPRIEIGRRETPEEWIFHVRDNGVGFDMKYAPKLFGVFQRLHSNGDYPGTGIGLAHVKRIVTRHGGQVWAESEPGQGATFSFSLPKAPPMEPEPNSGVSP